MKKIFATILSILFLLISSLPALAVEISTTSPVFSRSPAIEPVAILSTTKIESASPEAISLNVADSEGSYFIEDDCLMYVETDLISPALPTASVETEEGLKTANVHANVKVYSLQLSPEEKASLLSNFSDGVSIQPRSGPLIAVKQGTHLMHNVVATLTVTYDTTIVQTVEALHLCTASGSYVNLIPPPSEGIYGETSNLVWSITGFCFYGGNRVSNLGFGDNLYKLPPTFNQISLMPEGYYCHYQANGMASVSYELFCTRGVTVTVKIDFGGPFDP